MTASRRFVVLALLATSIVRGIDAGQSNESELRLKAAFIVQFPQFVSWPAVGERKASFEFCVSQSDTLASFLAELASGEAVDGRPIEVVSLRSGDDVLDCDALVIMARSDGFAALLKQAKGRPVLTISDSDRFLEEGGIIALRVVNQRVRFEIDIANAQRAGLQLSSHLLRLAFAVRGGPT